MRKKLEELSVENFEPRINYIEHKTEEELAMIKYGAYKKKKEIKNYNFIEHKSEKELAMIKYGTLKNKKDIKKNKTFYFIVFAIICILFGILNYGFNDIDFGFYFFGFIFFIVALFFAFYCPFKLTVLPLFSFGGIGFCIMLIPIISKYKLSIYLSDSPTKLIMYLVLILVFTILAFFCSTTYILNDKLKSNLKYCKFILISFLIVIAMVTFLPKLLPYLI